MNEDISKRLAWLDLVRGMSAVAVCGTHLRAAIFVDYGLVEDQNIAAKLFYFGTGIGHQAVMVFFVLSGYFVGGSVLTRGDSFSWRPYILARLSRLWMVLVPALLLTLLVDSIFAHSAPGVIRGEFLQIWRSGPNLDGLYSAGPLRFLSNLCFLQTVVTPVYGSNTPLWSLANEFWYYLIFPLAVSARNSRYRPLQRIAALAIILILWCWLPASVKDGLWVWLMGVMVWWLSTRYGFGKNSKVVLLLGILLTAGSLIWVKSPNYQLPFGIAQDIVVGFGFSVLALSLGSLPLRGALGKAIEFLAHKLSDISYSLYLSHFPLTLAVSIFLFHGRQIQPSYVSYSAFAVILAALVLAGWGFWYLFERHTKKLKNWLGVKLTYTS